MHRFRFLIVALAGLFVALSALAALASAAIPKVCRIELRDGFARILDAPCALNPKDVAALSRGNATLQAPQQIVELGDPRPAPRPREAASVVADGWRVAPFPGTVTTVPAVLHADRADPHLQLVAEADPNPRFIPLCSALGEHPGSIECIPDESVEKYQETRLWTYAARQLPKCSIVVLDPDGPFVAENLGYRCDGVITGGGILPDAAAE